MMIILLVGCSKEQTQSNLHKISWFYVSLKILSDFEPIEFISPCAPYQITEGSESFHMVLGTNGGSFDGWYTDILPAYLHNVNRKDIVNIQPR